MAYVPVPKDLSKVKTKVAFNLTKRQIVCFAVALLLGLPLFFLLKDSTGTSLASMAMIAVMLPCFLFAMYEKHGQPLEVVVKNIIRTKFIAPKERPYPKFQEKLQVCKDLLHGFDFSSFIDGSPLVMAKLVTGGVNFVLDAKAPKRKDLFLREAMLLKQSHSLCSSMTTEQERHEAAYMEAVRSTVVKITYGGSGGKTLSLKEINAQINELLKASIQSQGVISLFDSKQADENISLFDPAVLDEISKMKEKNIAVEILKKLMAEQVSLYKRTNVVQSQKFSEKIAQLMNSYYNGLITNEEVIKELLKTAQEITELYNNGKKLGLTQEELAFYDALTKPENIKDFYQNNELIDLTRELTEMLRKNRTIDWQKKETARASMRKMVKHLLKKYKYPPEDYDTAISTVISQCEMWTDNMTA